MSPLRLFFDARDYELLQLIEQIESNRRTGSTMHDALDANLHPHGVKELVYSPEFRIAHAVINLLTSPVEDQAEIRLAALRTLHDETLASAHSTLRINTARALVQIMKDLVARSDIEERLALAHEFHRTATGTPRVVRRTLERYHLLEMPEEWNQLVLDDHVHDAHSTGRKTPTHLIMDAWVKGIRSLTIVYCDHVSRQAAEEVLQAADIVGITARVALEYGTLFRGRRARLVWMPRGFADARAFLNFLGQPLVAELMEQGKAVAAWKSEQVLRMLDAWNCDSRPTFSASLGVDVPPLSREALLQHVGGRQVSVAHLAECLFNHVLPYMRTRAGRLRADGGDAALAELGRLDSLSCSDLRQRWLPDADQNLQGAALPEEPAAVPGLELRSISPAGLTRRLARLHSDCRIVLCLADLTQEDVLEILWDCQGRITHLELFNARQWHAGRLHNLPAISMLRNALNSGDGTLLKQLVSRMTRRMLADPDQARRAAKFRHILHRLPMLWERYRSLPLRCRMGSASASREARSRMGLAFPVTLPARAQRAIRRRRVSTIAVPIQTELEERAIRFRDSPDSPEPKRRAERRWLAHTETARMARVGNMVSLAGPQQPAHSNGLLHDPSQGRKGMPGWACLNTGIGNCLKVAAGFIPAALTFWYTQEWWFLAWFGALIWFAITGVRNSIQMVISGGGGARGSLLRWRDHVSVSRICDSLLYTGLSVLLLEAGVRIGLLEKCMGITVQSHPLLVFTVLNVVNGLYIAAHNVYRGFPRAAAVGNLFRSALAIPLSGLFNTAFISVLVLAGVGDPLYYMIPCAAIISKTASDTVAAIIEGYADSRNNRRMRHWDYAGKLASLRSCHARLELMFPEDDILLNLNRARRLIRNGGERARLLERDLCIHALDLMYFWFHLPRAQDVFAKLLRAMTDKERKTLLRLQLVLCCRHTISKILINGDLVGRNFRKPLAFYLNFHGRYLRDMAHMIRRCR